MGSADYDGRQADYDENCPSKMAVTFSYNSRIFPHSAGSSWDPYNQVVSVALFYESIVYLCTGLVLCLNHFFYMNPYVDHFLDLIANVHAQ